MLSDMDILLIPHRPITLQDAVATRMARPGGDDEHMWRLLSLLYVRQGRPELCLAVLLQVWRL